MKYVIKYKHKFDKLIKELCNLYNINKIYDMNYKQHKNLYKKLSGCKKWHTNSCMIAGRDEVYIGFYINPHLKLFSILHEIGHVLTTQEEIDYILSETDSNEIWVTKYEVEKLAWEKAFELAILHKIYISKSSMTWATKQLNTYDHSKD